MVGAVYELTTVKPFLDRDRGYTWADWAIYCAGYYRALVAALQVLDLAVDRWRTDRRERRRHAADARRRAAASVVDAQRGRGVAVPELDGTFGGEVAQRWKGIHRNLEAEPVPGAVVAERDLRQFSARSGVYVPFEDDRRDVLGHAAKYAVQICAPQLENEKESPARSVGESNPATPTRRSGSSKNRSAVAKKIESRGTKKTEPRSR